MGQTQRTNAAIGDGIAKNGRGGGRCLPLRLSADEIIHDLDRVLDHAESQRFPTLA